MISQHRKVQRHDGEPKRKFRMKFSERENPELSGYREDRPAKENRICTWPRMSAQFSALAGLSRD
jgi:hypothetical protein